MEKQMRNGHVFNDKYLSEEYDKYLSEELIEEIVLWLPPQSVAKFKCVSTLWNRRLSKLSFADRYKSRNVSLLGFFYNRSYRAFKFAPIPSNFPSTGPIGRLIKPTAISTGCPADRDEAYCVLNSSNGLQLIYYSNFLEKTVPTNPSYIILNPITAGRHMIINFAPVSSAYFNVTKRFLVFGFAFDPYCSNPNFTIVEATTDVYTGNRLVFHLYSSLVSIWDAKIFDVPDVLGDDYMLSGPSTYFNGALHWLLEPSGVVGYHIRRECALFSLMNIPGDRAYVDENGFCGCVEKVRGGGCYTSGECSCRYLGESRNQLVYVRVTGDSEFSLWTLEDYYRGIWSHRRRIVVDELPASLFFGRVVAFDGKDAHVVFLRVKRKIFSYDCIRRELKELCQIQKEYGGDENCLGFIFPYYLPRLYPFFPDDDHLVDSLKSRGKRKFELDPIKMREMLKSNAFKSRLKKNAIAHRRGVNRSDLVHLYHHFGVSQVAIKFFPHLQPLLIDPTGPPTRSSYDFYASRTDPSSRTNAMVRHNDFVKVEACLYGCVSERIQQNA